MYWFLLHSLQGGGIINYTVCHFIFSKPPTPFPVQVLILPLVISVQVVVGVGLTVAAGCSPCGIINGSHKEVMLGPTHSPLSLSLNQDYKRRKKYSKRAGTKSKGLPAKSYFHSAPCWMDYEEWLSGVVSFAVTYFIRVCSIRAITPAKSNQGSPEAIVFR